MWSYYHWHDFFMTTGTYHMTVCTVKMTLQLILNEEQKSTGAIDRL